jgi:nitrogen fixation/metabolism regulation signal transduction histidine kinase
MGFQTRILLSMLLVIVLSLTGTMFVAWQFASNQEETYNAQRLTRKESAVERSLEYTLSRLPYAVTTREIPAIFSDRICELADIHGMDIALYDLDGSMMTQSTLQEFEGAIVQLDGDLLLSIDNSTVRVKGMDYGPYVNVYWNVKNDRGAAIGIAGVRYQKRTLEEGDFKAFWSQLAPLYVALLIGAALIAALLSRGLVKSLRMIRDRMRDLEPGSEQVPIEYDRQDAIGELVTEYNALLSQLQVAVEALAKREREGAWRMMAMQVAHEIKNPLTPIKLGTQQLQRAWSDAKPDFDARLKRHCEVVIQQIDVLTEIAHDFSSLAAIGLDELEPVDICEVLLESASLYRSANTSIEWELNGLDERHEIPATRSHLLRVFNNLISNAVDAVRQSENPRIVLTVIKTDSLLQINVTDNGHGISVDEQKKIFEPRFTTKGSGTGLGLTIAQSIIDQLSGKLEVDSDFSAGAQFRVLFQRK